eukprot:COSAG06_NODE_36883_length_441_cov_4.839181_1_plen_81_part_10
MGPRLPPLVAAEAHSDPPLGRKVQAMPLCSCFPAVCVLAQHQQTRAEHEKDESWVLSRHTLRSRRVNPKPGCRASTPCSGP